MDRYYQRLPSDVPESPEPETPSGLHLIPSYLDALGNPTVEVRLFPKTQRINGGYVGRTVAGYFDSAHYDQIPREVEKYNGKAEIYHTLHRLVDGVESRYFESVTGHLSRHHQHSDTDISHFTSFPLDIDPQRPRGIPSTQAELDSASDVIRRLSRNNSRCMGISLSRSRHYPATGII